MATQTDLIEQAIKLKGSQAKLASALGCSQQQVSQMLAQKIGVSAEMAVRLHGATGGAVSKFALRPDIFGRQPETAA